MNRLTLVLIVAAAAIPSFAQHVGVINPSRGMTAPAGAYQYGNILFPGGIVSQSHASRVGSSISGFPPYRGVAPGRGGLQPQRNRTVIVPYAYPVYYGDAGYSQQQIQPNVTVVMPEQPTPTVVINQYGADQQTTRVAEGNDSGGIRVWDGAAGKAVTPDKTPAVTADVPSRGAVADEKPNIYLIALKDSTLRAAIGYWVEDGTLHYVTPQSTVNRVTLDMVDRELSEQLNRERKLDFDIKGAQTLRR